MDEEGKIVAPFFFLDVAKKAKLYRQLAKVMIEKSFRRFAENTLEFSINLTVEDIFDEELAQFLKEKIGEYGVADRLVLEVVESEEIENFVAIKRFFDEMKAMGCKIAIDDFGTGYSNFAYLAQLQVDYIKLDGSLIKNIATDPNARLIAQTIHREIMEVLAQIGVHYAQGYHVGKPEPTLVSLEKG